MGAGDDPPDIGLAIGISSLPLDCARTWIMQLASNAPAVQLCARRNRPAVCAAAVIDRRAALGSLATFAAMRRASRFRAAKDEATQDRPLGM
jgi:hypothetical protein